MPLPILCGAPTRAEIVPQPADQGRHARIGMRVYPGGASQWYVRVLDPGDYQGRHRAICQHPFVPYRGDETRGCGAPDGPDGLEDAVRCGFYRHHHPTMQEAHQ